MKSIAFGLLFLIALGVSAQNLPSGFVYLSDIEASIQKELRYANTNNFIGQPIDGYHKDRVISYQRNSTCIEKNTTALVKKQPESQNF